MKNSQLRPLSGLDILRVPSFIVVDGTVYYAPGSQMKDIPLRPGDEAEYFKHGKFSSEYVGDDYAIIHHISLNGRIHKVFIPSKKRMLISNGRWFAFNVNYESYKAIHRRSA
ncbi:hypothetical protein KW785_01485 [Candidatus Parcubacteria bacterium]|nr:hypothetical protein [Candidatus Parcubacteria bacterium]